MEAVCDSYQPLEIILEDFFEEHILGYEVTITPITKNESNSSSTVLIISNEVEILQEAEDIRSSEDVEYMCKICLGSSKNMTPMASVCGHLFCRDCIFIALSVSEKCPYCTTPLDFNGIFKMHF